jgi:hypothetical protein
MPRRLAAPTLVAALAAISVAPHPTGAQAAPNACSLEAPAGAPVFAELGRYSTNPPAGSVQTAAEIVAYEDGRMYALNIGSFDVVDIGADGTPSLHAHVVLPGEPTSVAVKNGLVAVAVPAVPKTDPGRVLFFRDEVLVGDVTVGALPDMVTFTPDGRLLLVANEGEPNSYGQPDSIDPEGSISVIQTQPFRNGGALKRNGSPQPVEMIGFADFNAGASRAAELSPDVRIFGPGASVAQDLEPEYITVSADGLTAWVSLQENNSLAEIDVATRTVTRIMPLGYADHSVQGHGLDASDQGGVIDIATWPVLGMYMPDGIANYSVEGTSYVLTANEGDARDWQGIATTGNTAEEARRARAVADLTKFPDADINVRLGRLNVTPFAPGLDNSVKLATLYSYGSRSFSIRGADGSLVWDSGDQFECLTALRYPANFNASNSNNTLKNRSDDKGPEPESVVVGDWNGRHLAFVALERIGGVMVYDVSDPHAPVFQRYLTTRSFATGAVGPDSGPEGMVFVPAVQSPTGTPLLLIGNEVSGTVNIWAITG